jgi:hypothetical protein
MILAAAISLIALSFGFPQTVKADEGKVSPESRQPAPVTARFGPAKADADSGGNSDVVNYVEIDMQIVELRGDVQRALKEGDFHESADGQRNASATGRSTPRGYESWKKQLEAMKAHAEVNVLSRPTIRALLGQEVHIQVGTGISRISYLVPTGKKTFEIREAVVEPALGLTIRLTAQAVAEDSTQTEISPLNISTTTFDGRELIPGVDLDVGKPIISTRKLETSIILVAGEFSGIVLPGPAGRQAVLFLCARIVPKEGRAVAPKPAVEPTPAPAPKAK